MSDAVELASTGAFELGSGRARARTISDAFELASADMLRARDAYELGRVFELTPTGAFELGRVRSLTRLNSRPRARLS